MCSQFIKMIPLALLMLIIGIERETFAQCTTNCTPLNETFGSVATCNGGTTGNSDIVNVTFNNYVPGGSGDTPGDGEYGIWCDNGDPNFYWFGGGGTTMTDHTADAAGTVGYFAMINSTPAAIGTASEIYHKTVSNLCANTVYNVSYSVGNIVRDCQYTTLPSLQAYKFPAGTAVQSCASSSCAAFSATGGTLLGSTGNINCTSTATGFVWNTYSYNITTGAAETSFDLILVSLVGIASGNDFALDDITVTWVSGGDVSCTPTTTPVEFVSFTAEKASQNILLKWSTASEVNSSHFVVERSTDAINFQQTGIVNGAGDSKRQIDYTYTDYSTNHGNGNVLYYRLRQVDIDGTFKYSATRSVNIDATNPLLIYSSDGDLIIEFIIQGEATYTVIDMLGRTLYSGNKTSDESTITVNKSSFTSGVYIVKVQMGTELVTKKILLN
jgi:hypothetical protein